HQGLRVPLVFLCEDNGWGISVRTPKGWVGKSMKNRSGIRYIPADGLDVAKGWRTIRAAVDWCRRERAPVFIHLHTERLMGHAGTDFEVDYRDEADLSAAEARDPILRSAARVLEAGLLDADGVIALYESVRVRCFDAADRADETPKLEGRAAIMAPLAPHDAKGVHDEATRPAPAEARLEAFGGKPEKLPENQPARHLAININRAITDLLVKYPGGLVFGEDVARKGGVYTVTKGLVSRFGNRRVFNTLLDEQTILGLAQGYGCLGMLPIPEIQYLAYLHNAADQLRGEACSLQFFSDGRFRNPMVVRIAGLGYQKGFGGHFHNDNSIAAVRDIPGLVVGCPSRGDDAAMMLRTLAARAQVDGGVSIFLEPIALYMTKDLHDDGDGGWCFAYPEPERSLPLGEPRVYEPFASDLLIITYGNGVPMSLRAARAIEAATGAKTRVMDLRWLVPLNEDEIVAHASQCDAVLVVDEGRRSGGVGEGVMTALVERLPRLRRLTRVVGADSYTPLGDAAGAVLPNEAEIVSASIEILGKGP
ncbi:MAG: thiamine pyrophosphate-dependent enzyme, partial [Pseudomonadota bacterium]